MSYVVGLRCLRCGKKYAEQSGLYICDCRPNTGSDLGILDVQYDYERMSAALTPESLRAVSDRSIARYRPMLPLAENAVLPPLGVGNTPLLTARRLGELSGYTRLYIKDDGRNPTGSLKDRASAIAVARAVAEGAAAAATASTGNAAAALAGMCAAVGLANVIFVPETAPPAKLAQLLVYGSKVLAVRGSYDQAFDLCTQACTEFGWYNRNTGYNPYMSEGKKTVAYEIAEQLAEADSAAPAAGFTAPDAVFVSVGDGCIVGGVYKGFYDLIQLGWIDHMPRIYGVQSIRSPALYNAWRQDRDVPEPVEASTRADSIGVNAPRDASKALRAVRESAGAFVAVSDESILQSIVPLARYAAVFAEPAGAAAYAGFLQAAASGLIQAEERIVIINTGSGLKDVRAAIEVAGSATSVEPNIDAIRGAASQRG